MKAMDEYTAEVLKRSRAIKEKRAKIRRLALRIGSPILALAVLIPVCFTVLHGDIKPQEAIPNSADSTSMLITVEYPDGRENGRFSDSITVGAYFRLISGLRKEQGLAPDDAPGNLHLPDPETPPEAPAMSRVEATIVYCDEIGCEVRFCLMGTELYELRTGERLVLTRGQADELKALFGIGGDR